MSNISLLGLVFQAAALAYSRQVQSKLLLNQRKQKGTNIIVMGAVFFQTLSCYVQAYGGGNFFHKCYN